VEKNLPLPVDPRTAVSKAFTTPGTSDAGIGVGWPDSPSAGPEAIPDESGDNSSVGASVGDVIRVRVLLGPFAIGIRGENHDLTAQR
jgi:hypothetical protein